MITSSGTFCYLYDRGIFTWCPCQPPQPALPTPISLCLPHPLPHCRLSVGFAIFVRTSKLILIEKEYSHGFEKLEIPKMQHATQGIVEDIFIYMYIHTPNLLSLNFNNFVKNYLFRPTVRPIATAIRNTDKR